MVWAHRVPCGSAARPAARVRGPLCPSCPTSPSTSKRSTRASTARRLEGVRLASPFVLRSVDPPLADAGRARRDRGLAPRQAHRHRARRRSLPRPAPDDRRPPALEERGRAAAGQDRARRLRLLDGHADDDRGRHQAPRVHPSAARRGGACSELDRGGLEVLDADLASFRAALARESHTLKRALTDPGILSGIGNAYSDEILHRARLSPVKLTGQLSDEEIARLFDACRETLADWIDRLRADAGAGFPEGVTAFRPDMAVHGRYGKPCPVCGSPVQRIVHADNETNYCARCQTGGRLLADRALSRLLKRGLAAHPRGARRPPPLAVTRRRLRPRMAAVYARPMRDKPTLVLLVRHGLTPTTGVKLPGRAPGLHLSDEGREQADEAAARIGAAPQDRRGLLLAARARARDGARHRPRPPSGRARGARPARDRHRRVHGAVAQEGGAPPGMGDHPATPERIPLPRRRVVSRDAGAHDVHARRSWWSAIAGEIIVAVSHADSIKAAVAQALGTPLDLFQRINIAPASITAVAYRPARALGSHRELRERRSRRLAWLGGESHERVLRLRSPRPLHHRHRRPVGAAHLLPAGPRGAADRHAQGREGAGSRARPSICRASSPGSRAGPRRASRRPRAARARRGGVGRRRPSAWATTRADRIVRRGARGSSRRKRRRGARGRALSHHARAGGGLRGAGAGADARQPARSVPLCTQPKDPAGHVCPRRTATSSQRVMTEAARHRAARAREP